MMNQVTAVCLLVLLAIGPSACAQKSSSPPVKPVKNSAKPESQGQASAVAATSQQSAATVSDEGETTGKSAKSAGKNTLDPELDKKIKAMTRQTLKAFAKAELTSQQQAQADELLSKAIKDYVVKRSKAEIDEELEKKRSAGLKEARAAGKSVKEQAEAAFVSAGFSQEQIKVFKATQAALNKAKREFGKTLSEEQVAKLPKQLQLVISSK